MASTNQLVAVKSGKGLNAIMSLRSRLERETTAQLRVDAATRAITHRKHRTIGSLP